MPSLSGSKAKLADELFEAGSVKIDIENGFLLKEHEHNSARPSPIKFNLRTPRHPNERGPIGSPLMRKLGRALASLVREKGIDFNRLVGLPSAGEPIALALARALSLQGDTLIRLSKTTRLADGIRRIAGPIEPSDKSHYETQCLMVDDVLSKGNSKLEAFSLLADRYIKVKDLVVLVERDQGGVQLMNSIGVNVHWLFTANELVVRGLNTGAINPEEYSTIMDYLENS